MAGIIFDDEQQAASGGIIFDDEQQAASGGIIFDDEPPAADPRYVGNAGTPMRPEDFADEDAMGGVELQRLRDQADGAPVADPSDGSVSGWLKNLWGVVAHNTSGRVAEKNAAMNNQDILRGTVRMGGKDVPLTELPDSELDYLVDAAGWNGAGAWFRRFLGPWARSDSGMMQDWDRTEGMKYADPAERKAARVKYAQDIARQIALQGEWEKDAARKEIQGRKQQAQAGFTAGLAQTGSYMLPFMVPGSQGAVAGLLAGLDRGQEMASDRYEMDADGNVRVAAERDSTGLAVAKGVARGIVEPLVERVGGTLATKALGRFTKATLGRIPLVKSVGGKIAATAVGKALSRYSKNMRRLGRITGLQSAPEEVIEEFEDNVIDALLGIDRRESEKEGSAFERAGEAAREFLRPESLKSLAESMLLIQILGGGTAHVSDRIRSKPIDRLLAESAGIDKDVLKDYTADEKWAAYEAYVKGLSEDEVRQKLGKGADAVNELMKVIAKGTAEVNGFRDAAYAMYDVENDGATGENQEAEAQMREASENRADDFLSAEEATRAENDAAERGRVAANKARKEAELSGEGGATDAELEAFREYQRYQQSEEYRSGESNLTFDEWIARRGQNRAEAPQEGARARGAVRTGEETGAAANAPEGEISRPVEGRAETGTTQKRTEDETGADEASAQPEPGTEGRTAEGQAEEPVEAEPTAEAPDAGVVEPPSVQTSEKISPKTTESPAETAQPVKEAPENAASLTSETAKPKSKHLRRKDGTDPLADNKPQAQTGGVTSPADAAPAVTVEPAKPAKPESKPKRGGNAKTPEQAKADAVKRAASRIAAAVAAKVHDGPITREEADEIVRPLVRTPDDKAVPNAYMRLLKPLAEDAAWHESLGLDAESAKNIRDAVVRAYDAAGRKSKQARLDYALNKADAGDSDAPTPYGLVRIASDALDQARIKGNKAAERRAQKAMEEAVAKFNAEFAQVPDADKQKWYEQQEDDFQAWVKKHNNANENEVLKVDEPIPGKDGTATSMKDMLAAKPVSSESGNDRGGFRLVPWEDGTLVRGGRVKVEMRLKSPATGKMLVRTEEMTRTEMKKRLGGEIADDLLEGIERRASKVTGEAAADLPSAWTPEAQKPLERVARAIGNAVTVGGEKLKVVFSNDRPQAAENGADGQQLYMRNAGGEVVGEYDAAKGEIRLYPGATVADVVHEFTHPLVDYARAEAKAGRPEFLNKIREIIDAERATWEKPVRDAYADKGEGEILEEIFTHAMGDRGGKLFGKSTNTLQGRMWYNRLWEAIKGVWRDFATKMGWNKADLRGFDRMSPDEAAQHILSEMAKGRNFGDVKTGGEGTRFGRGIINGKETATVSGYPLSIRDARDPNKVLKLLSPLVGKSAAQLGEMKLTRITEKSVEHLINSEHARQGRMAGGRDRKKLWRGTVAGMSVTDDIVATSSLGAQQAPNHLNAEWKKGATFYEADTQFAVEVENGQYEVYPCKLIVSERNGERMVYDLTEIGTPTPTTSVSPKTATVGGPQRGLEANGGVGASMRNSLSNHPAGRNGESAYSEAAAEYNRIKALRDNAKEGSEDWEKYNSQLYDAAMRLEREYRQPTAEDIQRNNEFVTAASEEADKLRRGEYTEADYLEGQRRTGESMRGSVRQSRRVVLPSNPTAKIDMSKDESLKEKYLRNMSDRYDPLKRLVEEARKNVENPDDVPDPYHEKRVQSGHNEADRHQIDMLKNKYLDFLKRHSRGQKEQEKLHEEVNMYLRARDALKRNPEMKKRLGVDDGSGMSDAQANKILDDFKRRMRTPILDQAFKIMQEVKNTYGLQRLVDGGMLDQATATMLEERNPDYAPQRTSRLDEEGIDRNSTRNMEAAAIKKALGRSTLSDNPVEFLFLQAADAAARTNENRTRLEMAKFVRMFPEVGKVRAVDKTSAYDLKTGKDAWIEDPHDVESENPLVVSFRENGKRMRIEFADTPRARRLAEAMRNEGVNRGPEAFDRMTRAWASTATQLSATFSGRNFLKDTVEVALNSAADTGFSGAGKFLKSQIAQMKPVVSTIREYLTKGTFNGPLGNELKEFIDAGGSIGGIGREGYEDLKDTFSRKAKGLKMAFSGAHGAKEKVEAILDVTFGKIEDFNKTIEMMSRFNNFRSRIANGESVKDAVIGSREDSTDFNMYGQQRWLNNVYMFSNSVLGGTLRSTKLLATGKNGRKVATAVLAYGFVEAAADMLFNQGDDDEAEKSGLGGAKNLSERERSQTLYFRHGGKYIRIPVHGGPFSALKYTGGLLARAMLGNLSWGDAARNAWNEWATIGTHFVGAGEIDITNGPKGIVSSVTPSVARPIAELGMNQDFAGRHIYAPEGFDKTTPKSERGFKSTGEGYKWFARFMNRVGGGNESRSADWSWFDNPPEAYKHVVEAVGKNMIRDIMGVGETAGRAAESVAKGENKFNRDDVPFLRDVTRNVPDNSRRYYSAIDDYERDKAEFKKTTPQRRTEMRKGKSYLVTGKGSVDNLIERVKDEMHLERGEVKVGQKWVEPKTPRTDAFKEIHRKRRLELQARVLKILGR